MTYKPHTRVKECIKCGYQGTWRIRWLGDMSGQSTILLAECKECGYHETWPAMDAEPEGLYPNLRLATEAVVNDLPHLPTRRA